MHNSVMELDECKRVVESAKQNPEFLLFIEGYVTSAGDVLDYTIDLSEKVSYFDLVRASLDALVSGVAEGFRPPGVSDDDWEKAKYEMQVSFEKSLSDPKPKNYSFTLNEHVEEGYLTREDKPDIIVLQDPKILIVTKKGEDSEEKPKNYRNNVTKCKSVLRDRLPVSEYVSMLNIGPEKVTKLMTITRTKEPCLSSQKSHHSEEGQA